MARLPLDQGIPRFKANEEKIDIMTNGDENAEWVTAGGARVPSVRKFYKDTRAEIDGVIDDVYQARDEAQGAAETAGADAAAVANALITPNVAAAEAAKGGAEAARIAAEAARDANWDSGTIKYWPADAAALAAITGMITGDLAFRRYPTPERIFRYSGSAWVDQGEAPSAAKRDKNADFVEKYLVKSSVEATSTTAGVFRGITFSPARAVAPLTAIVVLDLHGATPTAAIQILRMQGLKSGGGYDVSANMALIGVNDVGLYVYRVDWTPPGTYATAEIVIRGNGASYPVTVKEAYLTEGWQPTASHLRMPRDIKASRDALWLEMLRGAHKSPRGILSGLSGKPPAGGGWGADVSGLVKVSAAFRMTCDGPYPDTTHTSTFHCKIELREGSTIRQTIWPVRVPGTDIWHVNNLAVDSAALATTRLEFKAVAPVGSTDFDIHDLVVTNGGFPWPVKTMSGAEIVSAIDADLGSDDWRQPGGSSGGGDIKWPTTAFEALALAATRRVDFVMMGDSNQRHSNYGFTGAFTTALGNTFGAYATHANYPTAYPGDTTGIPDEVIAHQMLDGKSWYVPDGETIEVPGTSPSFGSGTPIKIDVSKKLTAHFGLWDFGSSDGLWRPAMRLEVSPYTTIAGGTIIPPNSGTEGFRISTLEASADARSGVNYAARLRLNTGTGAQITGPFACTFARVEADVNAGISCHTLYAVGSQSLWDMASWIQGLTDAGLTAWFSEVRRLQLSRGLKPIVVIYINSGLNDRNEASTPSRGWRQDTDPDGPFAYIDNLDAIRKRIEFIWLKNRWDASELFWLICPSHPVSSPDDAELLAYRAAASDWSGRPRTSFVDLTALITSDEMLSLGYYLEGGSDRNHLNAAGYNDIASRVLELIPE